jgi:hypothetical protein
MFSTSHWLKGLSSELVNRIVLGVRLDLVVGAERQLCGG